MKITQITVDVSTGKELIEEIELTDEQVLEMEHNQKVNEINQKIQDIRQQLQGMDYKTSKIIDGEYSDEEVAQIKLTRQTLREELRTLETSL